MKKIVVFGLKDTAELAKFYIDTDTEHEVIAFCVNKDFKEIEEFCGLPVVDFEDVEKIYKPEDYLFFAPMTGAKMNVIREKIYTEAKQKGYNFFSYISSKATVLTNKIGENCFILEDNTIQPFVEIGNNVVLWSGNHIGHHSIIRDNVFFTSHVVLSGHCDVGENSWFGVNSTIRDFCKIDKFTLIAMGSLVTKDTEKEGFYLGSPAKIQNKRSLEVL
jgi:sugar O-acyltransferase (sialic acid O-acetyltransferase NeuD family)